MRTSIHLRLQYKNTTSQVLPAGLQINLVQERRAKQKCNQVGGDQVAVVLDSSQQLLTLTENKHRR